MLRLLAAALVLAAVATAIHLDDVPAMSVKNGGEFTRIETQSLWHQFQKTYGAVPVSEHSVRYANFVANLKRIAQQNKIHNPSATFGVGPFAAMSQSEFASKYLMKNMGPAPVVSSDRVAAPTVTAMPTDFSWVNHNPPVVSPIKNQEQCGSCWAFSATENIESIWALAGNTLPILAPQQIVDCDSEMQGCNGGWPVNAMQYIIKAGGQEAETSYPYMGVNGACKFKQSEVVAKPEGWNWSTENKNETLMALNLMSHGPISIAVDASSWQLYKFGTLRICGKAIDHGVGIVAFGNIGSGSLLEPPYWLIRNSWGTSWGEQGYIKIEYGKNTCAVAEFPATATAGSSSSSGHSGQSGHTTYISH